MSKKQNEEFGTLVNSLAMYLNSSEVYNHRTSAKLKNEIKVLQRFMLRVNIMTFSTETSKRLLELSRTTPKCKRLAWPINKLTEFLSTGKIVPIHPYISTLKYEFKEGFAVFILKFIEFCKRTLSKSSVRFYERNLWFFNDFISSNEIREYNYATVIRYITENKFQFASHVNYALSSLTALTRYLAKEGLIKNDFSRSFPKRKRISQAKLPAYYSPSEIKQILSTIDRTTLRGKRDYAIALISATYGFRSNDIANLKFSNFNWDNEVISFLQQKTSKQHDAPIFPPIREAILDYLRVRQKSTQPFLFLTVRNPPNKMNNNSIAKGFAIAITKSGIEVGDRGLGPRSFRSSLATRILKNGRSINVVSGILGNTATVAAKHYIRIDLDSLRNCALEVEKINPVFFTKNTFLR